eukprot:CAMPEP_0113528002 /NCGR_PEP_ID=MMETSP0015_2-20120614/1600_1 /TAXON_ID=2838 /ORGANISM="Odontella" /LENGTH=201 /DNA_ID=CAMNT_0000426481 /DNA_START=192 /DNA_END=797 /DNA_ORIENTATION=+ /assembly_acc=CAM_ASM_000160
MSALLRSGAARWSAARPSPIGAGSFEIAARCYRGDSGEAQTNLSEKEEKLLSIARPKSEVIFERHVRMPRLDEIPRGSLGSEALPSESEKERMELDVRKKRLVYRSKQRGWLEVDLLLGTWAHDHVDGLTVDELDEYEAFVNLETIDIYNVITLRSDVPEDMKREGGDGVVERIQRWAINSPLGKASPEKYASVKTEKNLI